jgi:hypothetical protein
MMKNMVIGDITETMKWTKQIIYVAQDYIITEAELSGYRTRETIS